MPRRATPKGQRIRHREWVAKAIKLSIAGHSLRAIGRELGLDHTTVKEALDKEYADRRPPDEEVALARAQKSERLYSLLAKWKPRAEKNDPQAALVVWRIENQIADLEGTNAPKAPDNILNVSAIASTTTDVIEVGPEAAARLVRELFDKRVARPDAPSSAEPASEPAASGEEPAAHAGGDAPVRPGTPST